MAEREWKPGDVARLTMPSGMEHIALRVCWPAADWISATEGGLYGATKIRPLVVIDPESNDVERLQDLYLAAEAKGLSGLSMQAALREFANPTPPKPAEPTGLGAVVEDCALHVGARPDIRWAGGRPTVALGPGRPMEALGRDRRCPRALRGHLMSSVARRIGKVMRSVDLTSDCWLWVGELRQGYGYHGGAPAHRVMYELLVGEIPDGLELDHLCRTPRCVFPDHMEPATRGENMRRRVEAQTHCKNDHEYTPENTYVRAGTTTRICRACQREATRRYRERVTP